LNLLEIIKIEIEFTPRTRMSKNIHTDYKRLGLASDINIPFSLWKRVFC